MSILKPILDKVKDHTKAKLPSFILKVKGIGTLDKPVSGASHWIRLSDGIQRIDGLLASPLAQLAESGHIAKNKLVIVIDYDLLVKEADGLLVIFLKNVQIPAVQEGLAPLTTRGNAPQDTHPSSTRNTDTVAVVQTTKSTKIPLATRKMPPQETHPSSTRKADAAAVVHTFKSRKAPLSARGIPLQETQPSSPRNVDTAAILPESIRRMSISKPPLSSSHRRSHALQANCTSPSVLYSTSVGGNATKDGKTEDDEDWISRLDATVSSVSSRKRQLTGGSEGKGKGRAKRFQQNPRSASAHNTWTIVDLKADTQSRPTIRVQLLKTGEPVTWSRKPYDARDSSTKIKFFDMVLADNTGTIKAVCYGQPVGVKAFEDMKEGFTYTITGAEVESNEGRGDYYGLKSMLAIKLGKDWNFQLCKDSPISEPFLGHLDGLDSITSAKNDALVNVFGILLAHGPFFQDKGPRRGLTLTDETGREIAVTLWGSLGQTFSDYLRCAKSSQGTPDPVVVIGLKNARIGSYENRVTLSLGKNAVVAFFPKGAAVEQLRKWAELNRSKLNSMAVAKAAQANTGGKAREVLQTLEEITNQPSGTFTTTATVEWIGKNDLYYIACTVDGCMKATKLVENGQWSCTDKHTCSNPEKILRLNLTLGDGTGSLKVVCFGPLGESVIGCTASDLDEHSGDLQVAAEVREAAKGKRFTFQLRRRLNVRSQSIETFVDGIDGVDATHF